MTRCIIAGSRDFYSPGIFNNVMTDLLSDITNDELEIVSGGCRGADEMGEQYAKYWGINLRIFPADWNTYGKSAGPIRNEQMARYAAEADHGMLIAFPKKKGSRGTKNMIDVARRYGLEVHVYEWGDDE